VRSGRRAALKIRPAGGRAAPKESIRSLRARLEDYERRFLSLDRQMRILERERQKLSAVVNNAGAGFLVVDPGLKVVWANAAAALQFRRAPHPSALLGLPCNRALCDRDAVCDTCPAARPFATGEVVHQEMRLRIGDAVRHIYATAMPIRSVAGVIEETMVMLQDVSDLEVLRESQAALRASEERFRSIFENAAIGITTVSPEGRILQANPAYCQLVGYSEAELQRMSVLDITHPDDRAATGDVIADFHSGGRHGPYRLEKRYLRKDGTTAWGLVSARWILDAQGRPTHGIGLVQDIGEKKRAEEALHRSEEQLRQAQKMEAVGRLAGGVAHDFNNLLTVIGGRSDLLARRLPEDDRLQAEVAAIQQAAKRAAALTGQLLAFSRKQVLQPRILDLNKVVADSDKMLRRLIGEDIELSTILRPGVGNVKADPGQVEQVILNLAVNARDAMPTGGKLIIETAGMQFDETYVARHPPAVAGRYVMLALSDTGCGMDLETRARLFEPFFTTKEKGKGTGLGLATVYGIVKQSEGYIWVYSEPGLGSTFKIYLPRVEGAVETELQDTAPEGSLDGSETILLAEDESVVRELVREILRHRGYRVLEARDVTEARRISESHPDVIHLLLTDVVMPRMSGRELALSLAPLRPAMRVLYMSGYTDDAVVLHAIIEAKAAFLQKPFTPVALARKVRDVLEAPAG
jgi:PAS domain S-box-containing protein